MSETIPATVASQTVPAVPPLPETVLLVCNMTIVGAEWYQPSGDRTKTLEENATIFDGKGYATAIIAIHPPQTAKEVSDKDVCDIIRANIPNARTETDYDIKNVIRPAIFACVRAALTKGTGT